MADEITPRLNLVKPEVGGSADTWGDKWNENADKIDAAIIRPDEENVWSAPQHFDGGLYDGGERVVRPSDLGTAATHDVTTSPTDTTSGRVLQVGDGGILARPPGTGSFDFDDPDQPNQIAQFIISNATGLTPPGVNGATVLRQAYRAGVGKRWYSDLVIANADKDGRVFSRAVGHDGTQITEDTGWREHYHTGNLPKPLGVDQTWQDVTSSRASDTIYTNTTGRPIFVAAADSLGANASRSQMRLYVDYKEISLFLVGPPPSSGGEMVKRITVSGIVPPGSIYYISLTPSEGKELDWWMELR